MAKVTINTVGSLIDATTAATTINTDLTAIATALENTVSRDGTSPNQMNANLDMNSNRILNLPSPASPLEPLRFQDLGTANLGNLGTMALQNASAVGITGGAITGGTIGTAVTGTTQTAGDSSTKLATTAFVANAAYTQVETGAVSSPLITRLHDTLFASDFGAVGDDATNDYTALQAFLTAVSTSGKEGRFDPGKYYYVSGGDLTFTPTTATNNIRIYGNGAQIRTDPTQARTGFKINRGGFVTRADETRKIVVEGLRIRQYQDANALWGFVVSGTQFVTLRDCNVLCGSDNATVPYVNYAGFYFLQSDPLDVNTGSFWCTLDNCTVKGATTPTPVGLRVDGQCNAMKILNCSFANGTYNIRFVRPALGANVFEASIANGVRIDGCDFEGNTSAIAFQGTAGFSSVAGMTVVNCRGETLTNFFDYSTITINHPVGPAPVLGFNYSTATNYILNPGALTVKQVTVA